MAVLLFRLRGAPEDEIEEMRALLREHEIEFYETQAGNWGIGTAAIWLRDDTRLTEARRLLDEYQSQRARRVRTQYEQAMQAGTAPRLRDRILANPLAALIGLLFILFILYISLAPFLHMRDWL